MPSMSPHQMLRKTFSEGQPQKLPSQKTGSGL